MFSFKLRLLGQCLMCAVDVCVSQSSILLMWCRARSFWAFLCSRCAASSPATNSPCQQRKRSGVTIKRDFYSFYFIFFKDAWVKMKSITDFHFSDHKISEVKQTSEKGTVKKESSHTCCVWWAESDSRRIFLGMAHLSAVNLSNSNSALTAAVWHAAVRALTAKVDSNINAGSWPLSR